jgi:hypothetical protein
MHVDKISEADKIRQFSYKQYVAPARARGDSSFVLVAGDVHKDMHLRNRVPSVCQALKSGKFLDENGLVLERLEGPPSGQGTRVRYTYRFRNSDNSQAAQRRWPLIELRGVAREVFKDLGGGEEFLRKERAQFSALPERRES